MSAEYLYGTKRTAAPIPAGKPSRPTDPRGTPTTGRIARIVIGHGHGFIRLPDDREIYFHRGDLRDGTAFNDLRVGAAVTLEVVEDRVSGARALRVMCRKS